MSTPTAMLNQMASSAGSPYNTRKRQRESTSAQNTPSKKRATAANVVPTAAPATTSEPAPSIRRKSKSRLSRPSLPTSARSAPVPRRWHDQYELLESPEKAKERGTQLEKPMVKPKKIMRKIGQKKGQTASPFKGTAFEQLNELQSGAVLNSFDSPAKNTRTRYKNPLLEPRMQNLQQQYGGGDQQKPTLVRRPARAALEGQGNYADSGPESSLGGPGATTTQQLAEEHQNSEDRGTGSVADHTEESGEEEPGQQSQQETEGMEQHDSSSNESGASRQEPNSERKESSTGQEAPGSASPRQESRLTAVRQQDARSPSPAEEQQNTEHDEGSAPGVDHAEQEEPRRRRGRPAMSQEQRQARKEAEARQRAENALETEAAEMADFEKRGQKFVQNIEDVIEELGGVEVWSKMGGGAKTITALVAKKRDMETDRCQSVWRQIRKLASWFKGLDESDEVRVQATLGKLQTVATWRHLSRDGEIRRGDQVIIEIFEHLIPHSVYLIKSALIGRFLVSSVDSWWEMLRLVDVATSLCSTALEWQPRPSTLVKGIRREVRNHIRPALADIHGALQAHLSLLEQEERNKRKAAELERAQKRAQIMRQKQWDSMQAGMPSSQVSVSQVVQPRRVRYEEEVVDIDEVEDEAVNHSTGVKATQPRPHVQREATEEIPPPDPVVTWTEQEQIVLLNGLQHFRGPDRYSRILETSMSLVMKDIDQCIAQAQYYKRSCKQMLAKMAAEGDRSYDWLRSV